MTVSGGAAAAYSTDGGITWTASTLPASAGWWSVAYGGGSFVAVTNGSAAGNTAAYSTDGGVTWTLTTLPASANWTSVTYGGTNFVAVAQGSADAAVGSLVTNYTITFNNNTGTGTMTSETASSATALTDNTFTDTGYTFDGWNTAANGSGTAYANGASYPFTASTTLYAQWTANATDTVTFNAEGGSSVTTMSGLDGTTITLPAAPTYAGYTFDGWFIAASGGTALTSPYTLAGSTTLYAQWSANAPTSYTVTFDNNTGSGSMTNETASATTNLTTNTFTKSGYTFTGWNTASDGTGTTYADGASYPFAASTTLYAQWTVVTVTPPTYPRPPVVIPPTTTTPAPPPSILPASDYSTPTSQSASSTVAVQIARSGVTTSETVTVPAGALVSGTTVSVYSVTDTTTLVSQIPSGQSYVTAVAVSWQAPDGSTPTAATPITITMSNSNIKTGDTIYEVTSSGLKAVGTASANGSASITFTNDPTFVIAHTNLLAQATLTLTSATGTLGRTIALTTVGGSGTGALDYTVTNGTAAGCFVTGSFLSAMKAGTCFVTATKAADINDSAVSSLATAFTFRVARKATRVTSPVWSGRSVVTNILGTGFYGNPRITSNVGGTRVGVLRDNGTRLTLRVTVAQNTARGVHVFTIVFAKGQSITVRYNQR